jgi:hypothetical protein
MPEFDLLITGGTVVDPVNNRQGIFDVGLADGVVAAVDPELSSDEARQGYDAKGKLVLPGLVDTHVHLTPRERAVGFGMLARAGVTCALDCGGFVEDIINGMTAYGAGISVAVLNRLDPGVSISGPNASRKELAEYLNRSLESGAFGFKLLGGHFPLTPETIASAIELCNESMSYAAFHCGSTKNGSNLFGLLEALELASNMRVQICHVNAYCRGLTHGSAVEETKIALKELAARPHVISESHMATFNSCGAKLEGELPRSHVTQTCLKAGGFAVTRAGVLAAVRAGYMRVEKSTAQEVIYLDHEEGARYLEEVKFETSVSFPVNRRSTAFLMATEKNDRDQFIVTALSTDGGGIPRNFLLSRGLSLVKFDALTLSEFVHKCSAAPAQMLGLPKKGHVGPGADGDLIVVDPSTHQALLTVAGGKVIMVDGIVVGSGGTLITTEQGKKGLGNGDLTTTVADLAGSLFYTAQ